MTALAPTSITCPKCGMTSHNPHDAANGYCGNCHEFTGDLPPLPPKWGSDYQARQLQAVLAELDLPKILPDEPMPPGTRENGDPINLPAGDAMALIQGLQLREALTAERLHAKDRLPIVVYTTYLGVDLSTHGPLPLIWQTLVIVDPDGACVLMEPFQYATLAAARAGHDRVVTVIREALGVPE
jgi:hypothetical protein